MGSGAFSCTRGRGRYVEIVDGDPFEVDFVVLGVLGRSQPRWHFFNGELGE